MNSPAPQDDNRTVPQPDRGATNSPATAGHLGAATVVRPGAQAPPVPNLGPDVPGFVVTGEIARGGMGVVLAAIETALDREVALKTLLPGAPGMERAAARFVEEARIAARLQHPGITPVYTAGRLADGRPFLAMKLIRGRTFAAILAARDPGASDPVHVFEQICQAVGYAHAQGIIHRDLKPANVMVGAFGEVQVMDWGIAKELAGDRSEPAGGAEARTGRAPDSTVAGSAMGTPHYMPPEQARGEWDRVDARADVFALGGILAAILTGEAPYTGDTAEAVLRRAEVGDLGACFERLGACGADPELVDLAKRCLAPDPADRPAHAAAVADLIAAHRAGVEARLRAAETERVASAAKVEEARLRVVAEQRAKRAAEERAEEATRRADAEAANVREQRRRRRTQVGLMCAVGLLVVVAVGFGWWDDRQREKAKTEEVRLEGEKAKAEADGAAEKVKRELTTNATRQQIPALLGRAREFRQRYRFKEAEDTIAQAAALAESGGADDLQPGIVQARADLAFVRELDRIRYKKWVWVIPDSKEPTNTGKFTYSETGKLIWMADDDKASTVQRLRQSDPTTDPEQAPQRRDPPVQQLGQFDTASAPPAYRAEFAERGFDFRAGDPADLADRLRASDARSELVEALDDWAVYEPDAELAARLLAVLRAADPGEWLDRFRDPATRRDPAKLRELAASADVETIRPITLALLGELMKRLNTDPLPLLTRALIRHPAEFTLAFARGLSVDSANPASVQTAIGFLRAARAIRPDNYIVAYSLGNHLSQLEIDDEAVAAFREALRLERENVSAYVNLGNVLRRQQNWPEVVTVYTEVLKRDRKMLGMVTFFIGQAWEKLGDRDGMVKAARLALQFHPNYSQAHNTLGTFLSPRDPVGAMAAFRRAIELDPNNELAYRNLGPKLVARKEYKEAIAVYEKLAELEPTSDSFCWLGKVYKLTGDRVREEAVYTAALCRRVDTADVNCGIADIYRDKRDWERAVDWYRRAAVRDPRSARANWNLASLSMSQRKWDEAAPAFRRLTEIDPNEDEWWNGLGVALFQLENYPEAASAYQRAVELVLANAFYHDNLCLAFLGQKNWSAAACSARRAIELNPKLVPAYNNLGVALMNLDDVDGAILALATGLNVDKTYARGYRNLGDALHRKGELAYATAAYRKAAELDPGFNFLLKQFPLVPVAPMPRETKSANSP